MPINEKRRQKRVRTVVYLRYTNPTIPPVEQMTDLSEYGMFIHSEEVFEPGSVMGIELSVLGYPSEPIFIKGRVVTAVRPHQGDPCGMGVEFVSVPPRELAQLRRMLSVTSEETTPIVLLTEDDRLEKMIHEVLSRSGHLVIGARDLGDISSAAMEKRAGLAIVDVGEQEPDFKAMKAAVMGLPLIVICQRILPTFKAQAAQLGLFELLEKPVDNQQLVSSVRREIQSASFSKNEDELSLAALTEGAASLVARSACMQEVIKQIHALAPMPQPVLIIGETGSGKEVVARASHRIGPRRALAFTVADCTLMDKNLMASMLFGHEKGAFTGADSRHEGLAQQAGDGTLFLDEVGELSMDCQAKLLRLLESGTYRRIGGRHDLSCKARIIAASNRDLRAMVKRGEFREDLLYRLQVHTIHVPALRERAEDLLLLAHQLIQELNEQCGSAVSSLGPEAISQILSHQWNGNVRELKNVLATSMVGMTDTILPALKIEPDLENRPPVGDEIHSLKEWREFQKYTRTREREFFRALLAGSKGVINEAAARAGMTRQYFSKKLKEHGILADDFKIKSIDRKG